MYLKRLAVILCFAMALGARAQTATPIFVTIVMHNEESEAYDTNALQFLSSRSQLVDFANMLYSNQVMFNWQSDWRFLAGVTNFDTGGPETGGTNVVAWLQSLGFELDPHAHQTTNNYADVAYRYTLCGVQPSHTVGGYVAWPPTNSILKQVSSTITGWVFTSFTWTPQILWGGGSGSHVDETNQWASGIWRPKNTNEFMIHSETSPVPNVGNFSSGTNQWENLDKLIAYRSAGLLCTDRLYTVNVMNNQRDLSTAYRTNFEARLRTYTNVPNLRWVGIAQAVGIWVTNYNARPNILPFDLALDVDNDGLDDGWEFTNQCGITWTDGTNDFDGDSQSDVEEYVADTSPTNDADVFVVGSLQLVTSNGAEIVTWDSSPGRIYTLQSAAAVAATWTNAAVAFGTGLPISYTNASGTGLYWRVMVRLP